jgi:hypothetical protein
VQVLVARYLAGGETASGPRSRRPHASPQRTSWATEDAIVALREELAQAGLDAGAETIAWHLRQRAGAAPSVATIWRILARRGFVTPQPHKRPRSSWHRFAADLPNELWQAGITHWPLAGGSDAEIPSIVGDHSRLLAASTARRIFKAIKILFDGALFLRGLRDLLADIPRDGAGPQIPALIYQALGPAASSSLQLIAARMATDQTYCDGYQPKCSDLHSLTEGAYYSILCRDIQPFTDRRALAQLAGHDPAYLEAFTRNPYLDVCTRWKVRPADPSVVSPVHTTVPTLMFAGQFDPFGALPITKQAAMTFSRAWVKQVPSIGHNVLGVDACSRSIRNAWVNNPTSPPANTSCLRTLHLAFIPLATP